MLCGGPVCFAEDQAQDDEDGPKTVAVLITGQARTFNRTICSLEYNVIRPLQEAGYTVHIFGVVPRVCGLSCSSGILLVTGQWGRGNSARKWGGTSG